jgi:hypothetical protein
LLTIKINQVLGFTIAHEQTHTLPLDSTNHTSNSGRL